MRKELAWPLMITLFVLCCLSLLSALVPVVFAKPLPGPQTRQAPQADSPFVDSLPDVQAAADQWHSSHALVIPPGLALAKASTRQDKTAAKASMLLHPTTVVVCKQVEDNDDADHNEGGSFGFIVADQDVTLGSFALTRYEYQQSDPLTCGLAIAIPLTSTKLTVIESSFPPTATWRRNAPGYPKWKWSDEGGHSGSGSGQVVEIDALTFATLSGTAHVTYTNRVGRLLNLCKIVEPNALPPDNDGGTWQMRLISWPGAQESFYTVEAREGEGPQCLADISVPGSWTSFRLEERWGEQPSAGQAQQYGYWPAHGYSLWEWATTGGQSGIWIDGRYSPVIPLDTSSGDVALTVTQKYQDEFNYMRLCKLVEDDGLPEVYSGTFELSYLDSGDLYQTTRVFAVENTPYISACVAYTVNARHNPANFGERAYPADWPGNADGYPWWELRDTATGAFIISGTGSMTTVNYSALGYTHGSTLTMVIHNKAGPWGNGGSDGTERIMQVCKRLEDNSNSILENEWYYVNGQQYITESAWSGTHIAFVEPPSSWYVGLSEGQEVCFGNLAIPNNLEQVWHYEYRPAANPQGYPRWELLDSLGNVITSNVAEAQGEIPWQRISGTLLSGDTTFRWIQRLSTRTMTVCMTVLDNSWGPVDGGQWSLLAPGHATVYPVAHEGETVCARYPRSVPDVGPWTLWMYPPGDWPGHVLGYPTYTVVGSISGTVNGTIPTNPPTSVGLFIFDLAAIGGDFTVTVTTQPGRHLTVCKELLYNGDAKDDGGAFGFAVGGNTFLQAQSISVTEGAMDDPCLTDLHVPDGATQAIVREDSYPAGWGGNTPGFPIYEWETTGGQSGRGVGSEVTWDVTDPNLVGDIRVTFINRTGPLRLLTLCKEAQENTDAYPDQGGTFQFQANSDQGVLGNPSLTRSEGQPRLCSPPYEIPALATVISATETEPPLSPPAWPGSESDYPQWTLLDGDGNQVAAGSGHSTGNLDLNSFPGNPTVVFHNMAMVKMALPGDAVVTKTVEPELVQRDCVLTYTIAYRNLGAGPAENVYVTDTLPEGASYGGQVYVPPGWAGPTVDGRVLSWYTPALAAGASGQFLITANVALQEAISPDWVLTNTVEITATGDPEFGNNRDAASNVLQGLQISKARPHGDVFAGWYFWYYIYVTNTATSVATGLVITDILPYGIAPYSVQVSPGGVFDGVNTVVWNLGTLGPRSTTHVWIRARTFSWATGSCLTNLAFADSLQAAPPITATDVACVRAPPVYPTATPTPLPTRMPGSATTVVIQEGTFGHGEDSYIYRYAPDTNYSLAPQLKVGHKQMYAALLRFDLSPIPAGASIDRATLEVYAEGWSGANLPIAAYAVLRDIDLHASTWIEAQSGLAWEMAGCNGAGDRSGIAECSLSTHGPRQWYSFDVTGLVQQWVNGDLVNNGLLLRGGSYPHSFFFSSAETRDPAQHPKLAISYHHFYDIAP